MVFVTNTFIFTSNGNVESVCIQLVKVCMCDCEEMAVPTIASGRTDFIANSILKKRAQSVCCLAWTDKEIEEGDEMKQGTERNHIEK